ncbi:MAG: hypothetical protein E6Z25_04330 [Negativicoccus succinicivorans]|uniref:hypothetical protein n=1 Tax=Negativicoccus succinicivorans TaxID=620903 RepID=UPI00290F5653|nr:hypothetical protein [Negativicoccus succinicivorans]MDU5915279.1 hypothetical protein [Negativicoccus succinicivorans]
MHKKFAALLLGIGIGMAPWTTLAYNHYAPNSFDEVERYTEGYQAAATLIEAGAAPGYDATLLERPHLTRFELARAVAAMLRDGRLTPAQREALAPTQKEYVRELRALGVGAEAKPRGNIEVSGDLRLRHTEGAESENDARVRIGAVYTTNSKVSAEE